MDRIAKLERRPETAAARMNAGAFLLAFLVAVMAVVMRLVERSWFGPAAFFGLYWSGFLWAVMLLVPSFTLTASGVAWIALSYFALIVGATLARYGTKATANIGILNGSYTPGEVKTLKLLVVGGSLLALCAVPILVRAAGVSISGFRNFRSLLRVAGYYTSNRYNNPSFREPALAIALWTFAYIASALGGRLFVVAPKTSARLIAFTPIVVAAVLATLMTTRALVLLSLLLWVSGYMMSIVERGHRQKRAISGRAVILVIVLGCSAIGLFIAGELVRGGGAAKVSRQRIYASVATSFLGSTSSFTMWFAKTAGGQLENYGYGARTLSGELQWLMPGFRRASVATFKPIVVGRGSDLGEATTVATLFRGWIFDFSPAGCLALFAVLGAFGARTYAGCASRGIIRGAGLSAYYLIVLYSMMGFVYKFTTLLAVSIAFTFYCKYLSGRFWKASVAWRGTLSCWPGFLSHHDR